MASEVEVEALVDLLVMTPMSDTHGYLSPVTATARQILASPWLAAHDAEVAARAWDLGYADGRAEALSRQPHFNPYHADALAASMPPAGENDEGAATPQEGEMRWAPLAAPGTNVPNGAPMKTPLPNGGEVLRALTQPRGGDRGE